MVTSYDVMILIRRVTTSDYNKCLKLQDPENPTSMLSKQTHIRPKSNDRMLKLKCSLKR